MSGYRITLRWPEGATPEDEAPTLANVYAFLINRKKRAAVGCGGSNDAEKEILSDSGTEASIPEEG